MAAQVRRAADRFHTAAQGRSTAHSFSFGAHYDPGNVALGPLVAHNDEVLPPGTGYTEHRHTGLEIVTWVVSGALRHRDDRGREVVVPAGAVQRLDAAAGVAHSEVAAADAPTRFVQSWLRLDAADDPDAAGAAGAETTYAWAAVEPVAGGWVDLAGREGLPLRTRDAALLLGVPGGDGLAVPSAPLVHLFVVSGRVAVGREVLGDGDALRTSDHEPLSVTAVAGDPRLLLWLLPVVA